MLTSTRSSRFFDITIKHMVSSTSGLCTGRPIILVRQKNAVRKNYYIQSIMCDFLMLFLITLLLKYTSAVASCIKPWKTWLLGTVGCTTADYGLLCTQTRLDQPLISNLCNTGTNIGRMDRQKVKDTDWHWALWLDITTSDCFLWVKLWKHGCTGAHVLMYCEWLKSFICRYTLTWGTFFSQR